MTAQVRQLAATLCQKLFDAGYTAYFAGGWVRDLLLDRETDEIDIATSAPPEKIQDLFEKTIPVGIAFGVVIVVLEGIQFEVTTFRKDHPYHDGRHPDGVDFSTPEKDAQRRDFTINGMFYDPLTDDLYDYVGGKEDLDRGLIRAIGNPSERFEEDRLRMIRAARFASRFDFKIDSETEAAIKEQAATLFPSVSIERVWQEFQKMSAYPRFEHAVMTLYRLGLLTTIFPQLQGVTIAELGKRVAPFPYFPKNSPTLSYLLELFPGSPLKERLKLCDYLKTSSQEKKLVEFLTAAQTLFSQKKPQMAEWARFYAHPRSPLFLQIEAAKILPTDRAIFVEAHETRQSQLSRHIKRIQEHKPLVTAALLEQRGIKPGKKMGELLKESERIAINDNLDDPDAVLKRLSL